MEILAAGPATIPVDDAVFLRRTALVVSFLDANTSSI
jgi:hypothetical protein